MDPWRISGQNYHSLATYISTLFLLKVRLVLDLTRARKDMD
jgi:hypothetical protein